MSSTLATTRSATPRAKRVSVAAGVSETMRWGSAGISTAVPSSSVIVTGNVGAGVAVAAGTTEDVAPGGTVGTIAEGPQAARDASSGSRTKDVRRPARRARGRRGAALGGPPTRWWGRGRPPDDGDGERLRSV